MLNAVFVCADAADVGGVCEDAAGDVAEAVHLREEVVAGMVADALDEVAVRDADLADVRGVDDELAAIGDDGFEFIHALSGDPDVGVHRWSDGEDAFVRTVFEDDVGLRGGVGGGVPRVFRHAEPDAAAMLLDDVEAEGHARGGNHGGAGVDDFSDGGVFRADDDGVGDERAEPVEEVEDLGACDAGEEVFVAAAESGDFVRENGPDDAEEVVFEDAFVDGHFDFLAHEAAGDGFDVVGGDGAEGDEGVGVGPVVIEDAEVCEVGGAFGGRDAEVGVDGVLGHGGMRAEGNEEIDGGAAGLEGVVDGAKHVGHGHAASGVGTDAEDAFITQAQPVQRIADKRREGLVG